jgi:hypothetical protein
VANCMCFQGGFQECGSSEWVKAENNHNTAFTAPAVQVISPLLTDWDTL